MCWLALSERKQEWLPEGSHCAGRSPAQWGSENRSTASLRRSGCFPAEPCLPERHLRKCQGQAVVARLFDALQIFPAVVGQLVCAVPRHENERAGDVDVSNIDVPVLMRGEWLNETFTFARLLATWTQHIGLTQNVVDCQSSIAFQRMLIVEVDSRVPIGFF